VKVGLDELTGNDQAVLLVLMAESRLVPNPELARLGPKLEVSNRERLNRLGLIQTTKPGNSYVHELTDAGWRLCRDMFSAQAPPLSKSQGKALYTLLRSLGRYLEREDLVPADVFAPAGEEPAPAPTDIADVDVEFLVRRAYEGLAGGSGGWVGLSRLRAEMEHVPRPQLDATLKRMYRMPGVSLIPEENQKVLTPDDRAAAVEIGDQDKHLIAIEP
jgi:hypothetical protein